MATRIHFHFRSGDLAITVISFGLAATCLGFAGYKIVQLQKMENPPADLGLNFPDKSLRLEPQPVLVDPTITHSTDPLPTNGLPTRMPVVQPYRAQTPVLGYRLVSVFDGIAYIEVTDVKGARLQPVSIGSELPGAGLVEAIEQSSGHWQVRAGGKIVAIQQAQ